MGNIIDSKFFISYNHSDKVLAKELKEIFDYWKINCFIDEVINYDDNFVNRITDEIRSITHLFVIISENSLKSSWVNFEIGMVKDRDIKIIPLIVFPSQLPSFLDPQIKSITINKKIKRIDLIELFIHIGLFDDGFVTKTLMQDYPKKFPNEVFAEEVLKNDITLERFHDGIQLNINRSDVDYVLISNKGKKYFCDKFVRENTDNAKQLDIDVYNFQIGNTQQRQISIPTKKYPIRWVSGGTLSIVECNNKEEWIPLFFRDIDPVGWNVSLGGSERDFNKKNAVELSDSLNEDLNYPTNVVIREFLEETLIFNRTPENGEQLNRMWFYWDRLISIEEQRRKADEFSKTHIRLRQNNDHLNFLNDSELSDYYKINLLGIETRFDSTNTRLQVTNENENLVPQSDILAAINILELGIEIVKILKYKIEENYYYLDGEILNNDDGSEELVRMPFALVSKDYLKDKFSNIDISSIYSEGAQSSFILDGYIDQNAVKLFEWDIKQRIKISEKKESDNKEIKRHQNWYKKYGVKYFYDQDGQITDTKLPLIFTPSTVKLLNYYFAK